MVKLIEFEFLFTLVHVPLTGTQKSVHLYGLIFLPITNLLVDVMSKPFSKTLSLLMALQYYLLLVCLLLLNSISAGFPSPKFSVPLHSRKTLKIVTLTIPLLGGLK